MFNQWLNHWEEKQKENPRQTLSFVFRERASSSSWDSESMENLIFAVGYY